MAPCSLPSPTKKVNYYYIRTPLYNLQQLLTMKNNYKFSGLLMSKIKKKMFEQNITQTVIKICNMEKSVYKSGKLEVMIKVSQQGNNRRQQNHMNFFLKLSSHAGFLSLNTQKCGRFEVRVVCHMGMLTRTSVINTQN